ncbi:16S rRNA (guanine(527)-N(7))-methyltransferase RsmG [Acuticoccus sp. M5D2P5]|uniref:16S rRNA (guanine(527)-N(7))-methyltransferase RsmG n=1 Tax=Acuticoccus kalidii TaxID=2910977 RepID=UPI001F203E15|nr:16S rRNA (guanine(527)-N(7))-methyltransferase RsmG [Acuticoccus kalidii]MCF3933985.1 16S rRNA (guanine(527)-N(7))-methyltransferase RsmG [Acuticoccus kalidii]
MVRGAVDPDAFEAIETFVGSCRAWGRVSNLVSAADQDRLWQRHVLDSLQLLPLADAAGPEWIDLGSGGGFPGMIVAIARRGTRMTLVESNRKKAAFLLQVAAASGASVRVEPKRIEAVTPGARDVVSARALASLDKLLDLSAGFFGPSTIGLFPKGRDAANEVAEARKRYDFALSETPSRTEADATILTVSQMTKV